MTDKKLTDNEIMTALEDAEYKVNGVVTQGVYLSVETFNAVVDLINRLQAKVIKEQNKNSKLRNERNRQQAEIERLKGWQDLLKAEKHSLIKSEAYKEFAEMLISKIADVMKHIERNPYDSKDETNGTICGLAHAIGRIKDLLKEKVGENNA